jgi:purine-nucleoside phosphorylase
MNAGYRTLRMIDDAAAAIRQRCGDVPETAVVIGSGLAGVADALRDAITLPYDDLPHFPLCTATGHPGQLVVGTMAGRRVAALVGRVHLYEGHDPATVVFATRVMGRLGSKRIILTNAAGGINAELAPGSLMVIDDHINLLGASPLAGPNDDRLGPRFPDMTEVYSSGLRAIAGDAADAAGVKVSHGVYVAVPGPNYETPAEVRFLRTIGGDAVGMSTVLEAIAARHMGLEILGLSCITNMAAGAGPHPLRHDEILATAHQVRGTVTALLEGVIARL